VDTLASSLSDDWGINVHGECGWLIFQLEQRRAVGAEATGLAQRLWQLAEEHGQRSIILDMNQVSFVSSSMMSELVRLNKRLSQHEGNLRLCSLHDACRDALHVSRLDEILSCYSSRGDALTGRQRTSAFPG
jgi:anti-anti-sigma factor